MEERTTEGSSMMPKKTERPKKNTDNLFKVSQSKVNNYRTCTQRYHYRYVMHLTRKRKARPLQFGDIVHQMHDADANGGDPFKTLKEIAKKNDRMFREEIEHYGEIVKDIDYIMEAYYEFYEKDEIKYRKFEGKFSEQLLEWEIAPGILFKGKIDGIADMKKLEWLVEHKNHGRFPNEDHRWRNLQSCTYIHVLNEGYGLTLDGTMWDYVRTKPPTRPQILKDGSLSSRSLDSLPSVVIDAIKQHKLNPKDYGALIKSQRDNLTSWFQRIYTPVKPKVIKTVVADFIETSKIMADDDRRPVRNLGRHCEWCEFEPACRAALQGSDEKFVLKHEFKEEDDQLRYNEADTE
jgi:CRISPR/Cas system-associated exonuclease Cas4 (RecB family)